MIIRILLGLMISLTVAVAAPTAKKKNPKLETDVNFEDLTVRGKYQLADEANATVEDDKSLNDLLQPRKNFKDRLNQTVQRN